MKAGDRTPKQIAAENLPNRLLNSARMNLVNALSNSANDVGNY